MPKRYKTDYPGVYFRIAKRIGRKGDERVFYAKYKVDGKTVETKIGRQFADDMTPAKANRIRSDLIEGRRETRKEKREREAAESEKWTVSRLWESYKSANPIKGIVTDQNRYDNFLDKQFGNMEPKDIIPLDVDRLRIKMVKTKKPATVRNTLELLRRICNYGANKQLCPGLGFKMQMPTVNNLKTEDLSPDQLRNLLDAINADADIQAADMMRLVLATGMRRGELFRLQWSDIDFDRGFIHLRDPKGKINQTIPLNATSRSILSDHPREKGTPYVFPGKNGKQRVDCKKSVNRIKKAAGLPADFRALHGLRHTYASALASSGLVDLFTLQRLLTHKSPQMTMRYAHLRDDALQRGASVADDILENVMTSNKEEVSR